MHTSYRNQQSYEIIIEYPISKDMILTPNDPAFELSVSSNYVLKKIIS